MHAGLTLYGICQCMICACGSYNVWCMPVCNSCMQVSQCMVNVSASFVHAACFGCHRLGQFSIHKYRQVLSHFGSFHNTAYGLLLFGCAQPVVFGAICSQSKEDQFKPPILWKFHMHAWAIIVWCQIFFFLVLVHGCPFHIPKAKTISTTSHTLLITFHEHAGTPSDAFSP